MKLRVANEEQRDKQEGEIGKKKKKSPRQDFCADTEGDRLTLLCVCVCVCVIFFFLKVPVNLSCVSAVQKAPVKSEVCAFFCVFFFFFVFFF